MGKRRLRNDHYNYYRSSHLHDLNSPPFSPEKRSDSFGSNPSSELHRSGSVVSRAYPHDLSMDSEEEEDALESLSEMSLADSVSALIFHRC